MLYDDMPDGASDPVPQMPDLQVYVLAALKAEIETCDKHHDLSCSACGSTELKLIAAGVQSGDVLTLLAGDGQHVLNNMPVNPIGSAIILVMTCGSGHVSIEYARACGGRAYRGVHVYPILDSRFTELSGGAEHV